MSTVDSTWSSFFANWPADLPRRGLLVTTLNEPMPFKGFMLTEELLLLERTNPDPLGSRFIFLGFETIASVKMIDSLSESVFSQMGFRGQLSGR